MLNRILILLLVAGLSFQFVGCSSGDSAEESTESAADADIDALDEAGTEGASEDVAAEDGAPAEESASAEGAPAAAGEEDILADLGDDQGSEDLLSDEAVPPSESTDTAAAEPPPAETIQESETPPSEPVTEEPPTEQASADQGDLFGGGVSEEPPPAPKVSLKKVKDVPYTEKGILANTVYIPRKDDNLETVSQKTGVAVSDLKKINGFLSRGVKVGDKIYYNSPKRPTDSERMITYYEDNGIQPQIYTAKAGDNIRNLGNELLGHKDSWKELWATNPVESKTDLMEGEQLRYWPEGAVASPEQMIAEQPPIQEPVLPPPSEIPQAPSVEPSPIMPGAVAGTEIPPAPPVDAPPVAPAEVAPTAKPPKLAKKSDGLLIPGLGQDETFAVGGLALLAVLGGALVMIRKNRAKRMASQTQTTQI